MRVGVRRAGRRDLHGDLLDERREFVARGDRRRDAAELDLHADLAAHVDVLPDVALRRRSGRSAARAMFSPSLAMPAATRCRIGTVRILEPRLGRRVAGRLDRGEDVLDQLLEVVGARDEVRFAVHLDEDALRAGRRSASGRSALRSSRARPSSRRSPAPASAGWCSPPRSRRWLRPGRPCTPSCPRRSGRAASSPGLR